jgi:NADPH:quinone reductase-like Zn-dependent oxidoreductase
VKAYQLADRFGIASLRLVEQPRPEPGPGQVLVRLRALSLNYRDLLMVKGEYNPRLRLPMTPISDGAGEVVALGPGATRFAVGDRVVASFFQDWIAGPIDDAYRKSGLGGGGPGLAQDYVALGEQGLLPIPDHLSHEEAAALPCAAVTAWTALEAAEPLKPGDWVLVQGSGGVSVFALQFAKLAGARIIATSGHEEKRQRLAAMGADATINYRNNPDWDKTAREITGGRGVDRIVEVGGAGTLPRSIRAARGGGVIALIGIVAGKGEIDPLPIFMRTLRVHGISCGSREDFERMLRRMAEARLHPVIDRVFPFAELPEALRHMEAAGHFGKICVEV